MPFVDFTPFFDFFFTIFLVYHDLKQQKKMYNWCPEVCIYTQKSTRIWKVYLNFLKCTWKVSIFIYLHYAIIESHATRHSAVSLSFSSLASHQCLWDIATVWLAVIFFSKHNRFAETHSYLQLSYEITDRLLNLKINNLSRSDNLLYNDLI